jgi:hypothetical protein
MGIIGISGKIGSGKDTIAQIISETSKKQWEVKKFAGKLKQIASMLTGISVDKFEDQDFKNTFLGPEWDTYGISRRQMTVRELLQKLGTEAMRNGLHTNTWVNALFCEYVPHNNWIITDVRFPNEYDAVKSKGGIIIRVNRPGFGTSMVSLANAHPSETALDGHEFDHVIENNGDLYELRKKVSKLGL